jgi:hypothetical protein
MSFNSLVPKLNFFKNQFVLICINIPFIVGSKLVFIEGRGGKHILHIRDKQKNVMDVSQDCHIGCLEGIGVCSNVFLMDGHEACRRDEMDGCLGTLTPKGRNQFLRLFLILGQVP